MKKRIFTILIIGILSIGIYLPYSTTIPQAGAAVSDWQKGVSIYPTWNGDFGSDSFKQSVRNAQSAGANYIALIIPEYQANDQSSDIYAGGDTPTDASLISGVNFVHSLGMRVLLKPHLGSQNGSGWRATINANDRTAWFTNYGNMLSHVADIANQTGAEGICMGTELIDMSTYTSNGSNTQNWITMINMLRGKYHGYLTYSANWGSGDFAEEASHIGFWGNLDYIGLSAYYPLAQGQNNPSVDALTSSWDSWNNSKISALHNQYNKPVLFTEIGYRSADSAHNSPFDPFSGGGYNSQEQVNDYQALMQYWNNQSWMNGVFLWNWNSDPNNGGQGNTDYTPQNKPAQQTLTTWWTNPNTGGSMGGTGGTGGSTGGTGTQTSGTWSATASASGNPQVNSPVTVSVRVTNSGSVSDAIADIEVYDSGGTKKFQQFSEHQTISNSQPGNYSITWTPPASGNYTVKVGVFNNNWSTNYFWGDSVSTIAVGQNSGGTGGTTGGTGTTTGTGSTGGTSGGGGTSTGPVTTNIWWPSDGTTVSGVQPFKAQLSNMDVSQYTMYWQVDGDRLNQMSDSSTDYPHKEVFVDVSGWNWKGAGPYTLNFVSKDASGNIISQKAANITITH